MREPYCEQLESGALRFERTLPGPIGRVWEYLVDPHKRALWFCGGTMGEMPGDSFTMAFDHEKLSHEENPERYADMKGGIELKAQVIEIDPPRLLVFKGVSEDHQTRFQLEENGDSVRFTVIQSPPAELEQLVSTAAGWHAHIGVLIDQLSGEPPRGFWAEHEEADAHYRTVIKPAS